MVTRSKAESSSLEHLPIQGVFMILRLILTIICLVILACFAGFNLDNKCNVNLLIHTFTNVPVFVSIIISFAAGVIFTLPVAIFTRAEKKAKAKEKEEKAAKKRLFQKKSKEETKEAETKELPDTSKDDSKENSDDSSKSGSKVDEKSSKESKKDSSENKENSAENDKSESEPEIDDESPAEIGAEI